MADGQYEERILQFVRRADYRPQKVGSLAKNLGIADDEYGEFRSAVKALMKTGRIVLGSTKVLTLPEPAARIVGTFRLNPRGFGFVIPESPNAHGDLYVPPGQALDAITGDTVEATVLKRGKRGDRMMYEGRISKIVRRGQSQFVGELCREQGRWFVKPDGNTIHAPIFVADPTAKSARGGNQVVVEVIRYPQPGKEATGAIVRVLGRRGEPEVDVLSIVIQHQIPQEFPPAVPEAARRVVDKYDEDEALRGREDLRDLLVVTIDPDDARDFDDAVSVRELGGGRVELGVHIADVSYFVRPGGPMDREARLRSNSVYFPRHVIPMLPEVLSNGLCSLQERQVRLTKSAFITYDARGKVLDQRFANSAICSAKRLTYRQATAILDGSPGGAGAKVVALLQRMDRLARAIRQRRLAAGMVVLDIPEIELVHDDEGRLLRVEPADTSFSHTIIEMFMVEANEAVGRLFARLGVPHLRRIHPEPDAPGAESLLKFLGALGLKPPKTLDRFAMQDLLAKVAGKPEAFAVNLAILRSMEMAEYSPRLEGHYALASEHYVHFTSPIRRYPDLTIHRLLDAYVAGRLETPAGRAAAPSRHELEQLGELCGRNERRAEAAERELKLVKVLRLLEGRTGDTFAGIITGVTNFGVFVQLADFLTEGLIRFSELGDDWWEVDADAGVATAERTGRRIRIGQRVTAQIARVDLAARQLVLALVDEGASAGKRPAAAGRPATAAKPARPRPPSSQRQRRSSRRKPQRHASRRKTSSRPRRGRGG